MPQDVQARFDQLMSQPPASLSEAEQSEADSLVARADRLMLRKAEAAALLKQRGHAITQKDFKPQHE